MIVRVVSVVTYSRQCFILIKNKYKIKKVYKKIWGGSMSTYEVIIILLTLSNIMINLIGLIKSTKK